MTTDTAPAAGDASCSPIDTLTTAIVAAFVSHNPVQKNDLPEIINTVRNALKSDAVPTGTLESKEVTKPSKAAIKASVTRDAITSFIDGQTYKTLKRHLSKHGLTPETYRERYGLPADYPVVAAAYSEKRSALAKEIGLGKPGSMAAA